MWHDDKIECDFWISRTADSAFETLEQLQAESCVIKDFQIYPMNKAFILKVHFIPGPAEE